MLEKLKKVIDNYDLERGGGCQIGMDGYMEECECGDWSILINLTT